MSQLSEADFQKIISRRDRRFDGRFYFGVKTTRIYCRPVCPAKPKPENIRIFKSASEAEKNGYRPCMRCRPDLSPRSKFLDGTLNSISRALRIIDDSLGEELNIESLANSLGMSDRHLRRLFEEHLGASPIEILSTQRLHFAKQLVETTRIPIADIAFTSGYNSLRRFNEAFKSRFRKPPSKMRERRTKDKSGALSLKIPLQPPYDWDTVLSYLARHECYGLERVSSNAYKRFVTFGNSYGTLTVRREKSQPFLTVDFENIPLTEMRLLLSRLSTLFDTEHNPAHLPSTEKISPNGIRVPGCFDPFETAVSIILSQLVSTEQAKAKLKTLVQRFGRLISKNADGEVYEFPSSQRLSTARVEEIGITKVKAGAIRELSRAVAKGEIDFKSHAEFSEMYAKFLEIKGIGKWTASMIAMRCLGDPDAFPDADLIVERAMTKKLASKEPWSSSRAYLTHCLWRDYGKTLSRAKRKKKYERFIPNP